MPPFTRRQALLAAASSIATLAGCTGEEDSARIEEPHADQPIEDYEVRQVRNDDGAVLFAHADELPSPDDERARQARSSRLAIVTADELEALTFGDVPEADDLRSFVTDTDFDAASVFLLAQPVEACYEIRLDAVAIEWDGREGESLHPHAGFCRTFRPADVACDAEEIHTTGFAIRLPVAAESSSGSGQRMSRGCRPSPRYEYFTGNETTETGGGEA